MRLSSKLCFARAATELRRAS